MRASPPLERFRRADECVLWHIRKIRGLIYIAVSLMTIAIGVSAYVQAPDLVQFWVATRECYGMNGRIGFFSWLPLQRGPLNYVAPWLPIRAASCIGPESTRGFGIHSGLYSCGLLPWALCTVVRNWRGLWSPGWRLDFRSFARRRSFREYGCTRLHQSRQSGTRTWTKTLEDTASLGLLIGTRRIDPRHITWRRFRRYPWSGCENGSGRRLPHRLQHRFRRMVATPFLSSQTTHTPRVRAGELVSLRLGSFSHYS